MPWLKELLNAWHSWLWFQEYECSEGFLSATAAACKMLLMLSYILISFHFELLFTPLGLTALQDKRCAPSQMLHGCGVARGTRPKFPTLLDHAAKIARLKIPQPQSTCKTQRKYILSIALWHNYLQYRNTWSLLWRLDCAAFVRRRKHSMNCVLWSDSRSKHPQKWCFLSLQWVGWQRAAWDAFTGAILKLSGHHPEILGQSCGLNSDFSRHSQ